MGDAAAAAEGPILVIGCGLIGASAAAGWSLAGYEVWGYDRVDLTTVVKSGHLARQVPRDGLDAALAQAAVVVLAMNVSGICSSLRSLPFRSGQLVTDVGSVKRSVMKAAAKLPPGVDFVGGHPMAGSHESGYEARKPKLFVDATWALVDAAGETETRTGAASPALERVAALARALGAKPLVCDAALHDRVVALTSHLPQLLATAAAAELEARGESLAKDLMGGGGRAFYRLAGSSFDVWRDVLDHNADELARALAAVTRRADQPLLALGEEFELARGFAARRRRGANARRARTRRT